MNQRAIMIGLMLVVCLMFGGMLAFDMKQKNEQKPATTNESILSDSWGRPILDSPIVDNQQQIVASSYRDAIKKSGEEGMPVLVFFEADWCSWCKKMKSETLTDRNVRQSMKNYILVFVNTDRNKSIARKFGVRSLPSYTITNMNETKLKSDGGFLDAKRFDNWLGNPTMYKQPKRGERDVTPPPQEKRQPRPQWPG